MPISSFLVSFQTKTPLFTCGQTAICRPKRFPNAIHPGFSARAIGLMINILESHLLFGVFN